MTRSPSQRAATCQVVVSGAALTPTFLAMNAAATLIAGFGLLQNSPAVIIGAMLIAMLFGPIVGIALALAEADMRLLQRSLVAEFTGVAGVLVIGYAVGMVFHGVPVGSEILSRTSPTILDLLIGLVGGTAGAFTFIAGGFSGVIVGVAIATALVPPLTSCGILLANGSPALAAGALTLFVANLSAIAVGATIVFWFAGHRPPSHDHSTKFLVPRLISVAVVVVLATYLTITLRTTIAQSALERAIRSVLEFELEKMPGATLVGIVLPPRVNAGTASAIVRTPKPVTPEEVTRLNDMVNVATGRSVMLHIRSVITAETTRDGYVYQARLAAGDDGENP